MTTAYTQALTAALGVLGLQPAADAAAWILQPSRGAVSRLLSDADLPGGVTRRGLDQLVDLRAPFLDVGVEQGLWHISLPSLPRACRLLSSETAALKCIVERHLPAALHGVWRAILALAGGQWGQRLQPRDLAWIDRRELEAALGCARRDAPAVARLLPAERAGTVVDPVDAAIPNTLAILEEHRLILRPAADGDSTQLGDGFLLTARRGVACHLEKIHHRYREAAQHAPWFLLEHNRSAAGLGLAAPLLCWILAHLPDDPGAVDLWTLPPRPVLAAALLDAAPAEAEQRVGDIGPAIDMLRGAGFVSGDGAHVTLRRGVLRLADRADSLATALMKQCCQLAPTRCQRCNTGYSDEDMAGMGGGQCAVEGCGGEIGLFTDDGWLLKPEHAKELTGAQLFSAQQVVSAARLIRRSAARLLACRAADPTLPPF